VHSLERLLHVMPDFFLYKRLFSFVVALLCFSIIVIFMEEYAEDDIQSKFVSSLPESKLSKDKRSRENCWLHEPTTVITPCEKCSEFEIRALKTKHCVETGSFKRVNCTESGNVVLLPCATSSSSARVNFHIFSTCNIILMIGSFLLARRRIEEANRRAYMRVAQFFESSP
uniref:Protein JTB n=1 Tax=Haemonchus contortus TaxID=6289 RepID=A0A912MA09_HAECO